MAKNTKASPPPVNPSQARPTTNTTNNEMNQSNLALRLELLESRLRNPSAPPRQSPAGNTNANDNASLLAELESPALSQHSFKFDSPSHSQRSISAAITIPTVNTHITTNTMIEHHNSHSNISLLSSSSAKPASSSTTGRRGSSTLDVVNLAAEQHMQKIAALENYSLTGGGPETLSFLSNSSHQTLQTSHRAAAAAGGTTTNSNGSNTVVKETPNTALVKAEMSKPSDTGGGNNPRALAVTTDNTTNQKKASSTTNAGARRKSTPVKRDVSSLRSRSQKAATSQNASSSNTNPADASRKRTRLQFSDNNTASNHSNTAANKLSPLAKTNSDSRSNPSSLKASGVSGTGRQHKTPKNNKLIRDFFTAVRKDNKTPGSTNTSRQAPKSSTTTTPQTPPSTHRNAGGGSTTPSPYTEMAQLQRKCQQWEQLCQEKDAQLKAVSNNRTILQTATQTALKQREEELATTQETYNSYVSKVNVVLEDLMRKQALQDVQRLREQLATDGARLGRIVYTRAGMRSVESWEDGTESRHLQERRAQIMAQKKKLEERQRQAKAAVQVFTAQQQQQTSDNKENGPNQPDAAASHTKSPVAKPVVEGITLKTKLDALEALESVRFHLDTVQRKLKELQEEEQRLQEEKVEHIRALKRLASEDGSRFRSRPKVRHFLFAKS